MTNIYNKTKLFSLFAAFALLGTVVMSTPAHAASTSQSYAPISVQYGIGGVVIQFCCNDSGQTVNGTPSNYNYGSFTGTLVDSTGASYNIVNGYVVNNGQAYDFQMQNGVAVVETEPAEGVDITPPPSNNPYSPYYVNTNPPTNNPPTNTAPPTVEPDPNPPQANEVKAEPCAPGCDCKTGQDGKGILGMIERRSETIRARNKALAQQIFKKPDNTMGMTCFDRALGVTARIGRIFSDLPAGSTYNGNSVTNSQQVPTENSNVFGTSSYPNMGMDTNLVTSMNGVISEQVQKHADNFKILPHSSGTLSSGLGTTGLGYLNNLSGSMQSSLNSITSGPMQQISSAVTALNGFMGTVKTLTQNLGSMPASVVSSVITPITQAWGQIQNIANSAVSNIMNQVVNGLMNQIMGTLFGSTNSLAQNKCDFMKKLWSGEGVSGTVLGFKPLVGSGIEKGLPYFKVKDLVNGSLPGIDAGTVSDFAQSIVNEDGANGVLNKALQDMQGPLSAPGNMPTWTTPPILTPGMSTDDIIGMMNGGGVGDARTAGILPAPDVPADLQIDPF